MSTPSSRTLLEAFELVHQEGDASGFTFIDGAGRETKHGFRSLIEAARGLGARLIAQGLTPGDRVALAIPEAEDFVLTFLGAITAGLVPVPLYPPLSLGRLDAYLDSTARVLNAAQANLLVSTEQVQRVLWSVVKRVPTLRDLVTVEKLKAATPAPAVAPTITGSDTLFLQFTSGSTAEPRGVVVTHASMLANVQAILVDALKIDNKVDIGMSWLPLYHDMGLIGCVLAPLIVRLPMVFLPTLSFLKRPTLWMDTMHKHRASMAFAPNFAYARLTKRASDADLARWDLSCVRVLGCGAEPIQAETMRAFTERFAAAKLRPEAMLPTYGMAEATLAMSFAGLKDQVRIDRIDAETCAAEQKAKPASEGATSVPFVSCGRVIEGHDLAVFSEDNRQLGEREIGEIRFRGPSVAAGYFRNPDATRAAFGEDGWLRTGDLGYLADGEIFVSGRQKDILIVHGHNYYPQAIEWLVESVEGVRKGNVVAFSIPGEASEEVVVVAETALTEAEPLAALKSAIASHVKEDMGLAVSQVELLGPGEMPKTSSGKLQRRKTREQFIAGTLGAEGVRLPGSAAERLSLARHLVTSFIGRVQHKIVKRDQPDPSSEA